MNKKFLVTIVLFALLSGFSGCSSGDFASSNNTDENQRLTCIEIYSAKEQTLMDTIEDKEILKEFNENTSFAEEWEDMDDDYIEQQKEIQKKLENYEPQYLFILYKTPAAINNDGTLEKAWKLQFTRILISLKNSYPPIM